MESAEDGGMLCVKGHILYLAMISTQSEILCTAVTHVLKQICYRMQCVLLLTSFFLTLHLMQTYVYILKAGVIDRSEK